MCKTKNCAPNIPKGTRNSRTLNAKPEPISSPKGKNSMPLSYALAPENSEVSALSNRAQILKDNKSSRLLSNVNNKNNGFKPEPISSPKGKNSMPLSYALAPENSEIFALSNRAQILEDNKVSKPLSNLNNKNNCENSGLSVSEKNQIDKDYANSFDKTNNQKARPFNKDSSKESGFSLNENSQNNRKNADLFGNASQNGSKNSGLSVSAPGQKNLDVCPNCGANLRRSAVICGINYSFKILCKCESDKLKKAQEEQKNREKMRKIENLRSLSLLGERYKNVSFQNTKTGITPSFDKAFNRCQKYCELYEQTVKEGYGIYIFGSKGTGKTHLTGM